MKKVLSPEQIEIDIQRIESILGNEVVTPQEEKKLLKERDELEKSRPLTGPYQQIKKKLSDLREIRDAKKAQKDRASDESYGYK